MRVTFWGTRGSLASAGPETIKYGGNTACVEVRADDGTLLVLDAGSGIRRLGASLPDARRIHLLLSHLHLDHILGLGFFEPLFRPDVEVHLWGPRWRSADLGSRLGRYLSPPLFPVRLKELGSRLLLHEAPSWPVEVGPFRIRAAPIIHPGQTVGYRVTADGRSVAYLPDHEPALGADGFPREPEWTSGYELVADADLMVHDAQYTAEEYAERTGWGHSRITDAVALARMARARRLVTFHHDPAHDDVELDGMLAEARDGALAGLDVLPGREGETFRL